jgi:hypothetical protein
MADRTFKVIVEGKIKGEPRTASFPCSGDLPYNGCDALEVMRSYKKSRPKVKTTAVTENKFVSGGYEALTIDEMEEMFGEETNARHTWERRIR